MTAPTDWMFWMFMAPLGVMLWVVAAAAAYVVIRAIFE